MLFKTKKNKLSSRRRLIGESLETRQLMAVDAIKYDAMPSDREDESYETDQNIITEAAITISYENDTINIDGTDGDDQVHIRYISVPIKDTDDGYDVVNGNDLVNEDADQPSDLEYLTQKSGYESRIKIRYGIGEYSKVIAFDLGAQNIVFKGLGGNDNFANETYIPSFAFGGSGDDELNGGKGTDWLYGDEGDDELNGFEGNDWLYGGDGDDDLYGGLGNDHLYGKSGNDGMYGGIGVDFLNGGPGYDRFLVQQAEPYIVNCGWTQYTGYLPPDTVEDLESHDARVLFVNGEGGSKTKKDEFGEDKSGTFEGADFTQADIEAVDVALAKLHDKTGNTKLLKRSDGQELVFHRWGEQIAGDEDFSLGGLNNGGHIVLVNTATRTIYHEIGHNFDTENPNWEQWKQISGWSQSSDNEWHHDRDATFVNEYAKTNPREDFASSVQAYFSDKSSSKSALPKDKSDFLDNFFDLLSA